MGRPEEQRDWTFYEEEGILEEGLFFRHAYLLSESVNTLFIFRMCGSELDLVVRENG
jgi:hypothetical protein